MSFLLILGLTLAAVLLFMAALWLLSLRLKNASIVDVFWGIGFIFIALIDFMVAGGDLPRRILVLALVAVWGGRLSAHIFQRNRGRGEDPRYAAWRRQFGPQRYGWISFFQVFMLQGAILWVVSIPLLAAMYSAAPLSPWALPGLLTWGIGVYFEAAGDWQLARFKANPANTGRIMDQGLWAYTRHPNYFGDALVWWGFYLIALGAHGWWNCLGLCSWEVMLRFESGIWTIFSPILMTVLLLRVSGVTLLEKSMAQRPGYREYVERTSAFLPLPRRTNSHGASSVEAAAVKEDKPQGYSPDS
jgi:steroid 5-alpha reductase family enzyme